MRNEKDNYEKNLKTGKPGECQKKMNPDGDTRFMKLEGADLKKRCLA
jgi:hypothetical protein